MSVSPVIRTYYSLTPTWYTCVYIGANLKKFIDLQHTFYKILLSNNHALNYKIIMSKYTYVFLIIIIIKKTITFF